MNKLGKFDWLRNERKFFYFKVEGDDLALIPKIKEMSLDFFNFSCWNLLTIRGFVPIIYHASTSLFENLVIFKSWSFSLGLERNSSLKRSGATWVAPNCHQLKVRKELFGVLYQLESLILAQSERWRRA